MSIVEVAPRDGLQSDPTLLGTDAKVEMITRAVRAGIRRIETVSFVNPKRVPQMADAAELLLAGITFSRHFALSAVADGPGFRLALRTAGLPGEMLELAERLARGEGVDDHDSRVEHRDPDRREQTGLHDVERDDAERREAEHGRGGERGVQPERPRQPHALGGKGE